MSITPTEPEPTDPSSRKPRPWWRKKRYLIPLALLLLILFVPATVGDLDTSGDPVAVPTQPASQPTPEPEPEPEPEESDPEPVAADPDGRIEGNCDLLLFTQGDDSEFAASADVTNTGNIGIVVRVVAKFDQLGRDDYKIREQVRVPVGGTKQVNLSEIVDATTVARHQDGGYSCTVDGAVVRTFGEAQ